MSGDRIDLRISGSLGTDLHVLGRGPTTTLRLDLANGHIDATFHGDELLELRDWITDQHDGGGSPAASLGSVAAWIDARNTDARIPVERLSGDEVRQEIRDRLARARDSAADRNEEHCTECGHPRHAAGAACLVVVEEYPIDHRCLRTPCECLGDAPGADRTELVDAVTWAQMYVDNDAGPHRRRLGLILDELERLQRQWLLMPDRYRQMGEWVRALTPVQDSRVQAVVEKIRDALGEPCPCCKRPSPGDDIDPTQVSEYLQAVLVAQKEDGRPVDLVKAMDQTRDVFSSFLVTTGSQGKGP